MAYICRHPQLDQFDLSSVGLIYTTGSGIHPTYERQIFDKMPRLLQIIINYGMSEIFSLTSTAKAPSEMAGLTREQIVARHVIGSSGRVLPGNRLKIVDVETGEKLGPGQVGEICGKTQTIMKEYLNRPEASVSHRLSHIGIIGGLGP